MEKRSQPFFLWNAGTGNARATSAPAYHADLLRERARCYLYDIFNYDTASSNSGAGAFDANSARWIRDIPDLRDTILISDSPRRNRVDITLHLLYLA